MIIVFIFFALQSGFSQIKKPETQKQQCDKYFDYLQSFGQQCLGNKYIDEFSPVLVEGFKSSSSNHETEMAILDSYLATLGNNPTSTGYIVVYGGRLNKFGEYEIRTERVMGYISRVRKFDSERIKLVHGGFREEFEFEFWTSEVKNAFPPLSPTVSPEKVKFSGKMKPSVRRKEVYNS